MPASCPFLLTYKLKIPKRCRFGGLNFTNTNWTKFFGGKMKVKGLN